MEDKARHINFNKFVEDRSIEINKFLVELELDTKKKGHQALPKSVRRRAMSHNRFRIPRKMRKNMEQELAKAESMQKLPKCRKHIRKRRMLIRAYKLRSDKVQWLSTHLWAAKRMRMVSYYGFKVAFTPNNKSFRSAYRHSQHGCTLADLSYYYSLTLEATKQTEQLPAYFKIDCENFPQGDRLYQGQIRLQDRLICPCLLLSQTTKQHPVIRAFFHPAAFQQIRKLPLPPKEQGWKVTMQQGQTDLYCLNGPQALSIVDEALKQYGILSQQKSIVPQLFGRQNPTLYLGNSNSYVLTNKPHIDAPISEQKLTTKGYSTQSNASIRAQMMNIFVSLKSEALMKQEVNINEKDFWQMFDQGQNQELEKTTFRITLRSRYTHHRKAKMSKQEKKKVVKEDRQSSSECGRGKKMKDESQREESSYQQKSIYVDQPQKKQQTVLESVQPLLIAKTNKSVYVWASNADSCRFWRIMSKLNVKVVGRKQLNHFHLQNNIRQYPEDYPSTKAFERHQQQQITQNFTKYFRLPLPKRPNYVKLNSPSPFGAITPSNPANIQVEVVSRGHCTKYSYLCELTKEDLQKISNKIDQGHIGIIHSEIGEGERKKYKNWAEMYLDLKYLSPSRKIVGSITSGGYCYSRNHEGGIGFIDRALLTDNYLNTFGGYLLIRKTNSPHYYLAQIKKYYA